jgi:uncharacterized repeat protein (TIGR03803 family)
LTPLSGEGRFNNAQLFHRRETRLASSRQPSKYGHRLEWPVNARTCQAVEISNGQRNQSLKTKLATLDNGSRTCTTTEPVSSRKRVLALFIRLLWVAALALPVFAAPSSAVLTTLYSFQGGADGQYPSTGLVQGSDGYLYGTTREGGANDVGTVFKISTDGAYTRLYSFAGGNDGATPGGPLVQGSDGHLYGTTQYGGAYTNLYGNGDGTVFRITTNGVLTSLYSFTGESGSPAPSGLVQGSDSVFYGTTFMGGANNAGTVFKISTDGALSILYSFTGRNDGSNPSRLAWGSDGNLYGMTQFGGTNGNPVNGNGTVFKVSTDGALTILHSFTGGDEGFRPVTGLLEGSDRYFYGATWFGGANDSGTVFKISTNGALTTLYSFVAGDNSNVQSALVQGNDGYFYGTTSAGSFGATNSGTMFRISADGELTILYLFPGGNNGTNPSMPVQAGDGNFYGTTSDGGTNGGGTVFRLTLGPTLQAVTLTNGILSLNWTTEAAGTYQLQYNFDLTSTNWINLGSALTATGTTLSTTDWATNSPQRFYRVVLSP